jgi:bifunctional non-homologous end joining protein LigD
MPLPRIEPMLARDGRSLPSGEGWAFEIKWDGVRAFAVAAGGVLRLVSRRGEDLTDRYPELGGLGEALAPHSAILDGEIVALDEQGRPSFQLLQQRMGVTNPLTISRRTTETPVTFVAFDLIELDGDSLAAAPYEERREKLAALELAGSNWQAPRHHLGDGGALLEAARRQGLEGVVAKRLGSPYRAGSRSGDWLKVRLRKRQDFVIGGWLGGQGGRSGRLGSLLLGVWDVDPQTAEREGRRQRLVYAGGAGSGLSERTIDQLIEMLEPLARETSPFELGIGPKRANPRWCEPQLVCSVEFSEWTREDTLRQPAFKGLRDDIDPRSVVRESG